MHLDLQNFCIPQGSTLGDAALRMDQSRLGIVLIVDADGRLTGTITDGDLRRAMLAHVELSQPVDVLLSWKEGSTYARPIFARVTDPPETYLALLRQHRILHLPILDEQDRVVGLVSSEEFLPDTSSGLQAVIMAGGRGSRLHPLTEHVPKPMLPVGDRPLLEIIIEQLREFGIKNVSITTHHKGEKIAEHFGDGREFGVDITYVSEDQPLGTAGGLGLLEPPTETMLVINGDILTQLNFQAMLAFHRAHAADLTVAVRRYDVQVPFGVVECEGVAVRRITEKPFLNCFVNAGVYLLEPSVHRYIRSGEPCDMPDLIQLLLDDGRPVVSFPIREYWQDIGQPSDYEQAQARTKAWKPQA